MPANDQPFSHEGYLLIGAAFEVHNELGGGLAEEIYQESFQLELAHRGVPFRPKPEIRTFYKDRELKKRYIPDLTVYERIIVELKAVVALNSEHDGQLLNYMRLTRSPVGYLINFGPMGKLEYRRFVLSEYL